MQPFSREQLIEMYIRLVVEIHGGIRYAEIMECLEWDYDKLDKETDWLWELSLK